MWKLCGSEAELRKVVLHPVRAIPVDVHEVKNPGKKNPSRSIKKYDDRSVLQADVLLTVSPCSASPASAPHYYPPNPFYTRPHRLATATG